MKVLSKLFTIVLPLISLYLITLIAVLYAKNVEKYSHNFDDTNIKIVSTSLDFSTQYPK